MTYKRLSCKPKVAHKEFSLSAVVVRDLVTRGRTLVRLGSHSLFGDTILRESRNGLAYGPSFPGYINHVTGHT